MMVLSSSGISRIHRDWVFIANEGRLVMCGAGLNLCIERDEEEPG
jgi:hypothetical protein